MKKLQGQVWKITVQMALGSSTALGPVSGSLASVGGGGRRSGSEMRERVSVVHGVADPGGGAAWIWVGGGDGGVYRSGSKMVERETAVSLC
ncbi:hypothetical protein SLA2020_527780 [Shorea laevis]